MVLVSDGVDVQNPATVFNYHRHVVALFCGNKIPETLVGIVPSNLQERSS